MIPGIGAKDIMAKRPVFTIKNTIPFYREINTEFQYYSGFADIQRKKSVHSLHEAFLQKHPDAKILEVSRFSDSYLGQALSAFNLILDLPDGSKYPLENIFQSSKVFQNGIQYVDLLTVSPGQAKKDERLKASGPLAYFKLQDDIFPLNPKTYFYDWIYFNALMKHHELTEQIIQFDSFTDIVFNPEKSINCQARTVAIYVALYKAGILQDATFNKESFKEIVYGEGTGYQQESLFLS